MRPIVQKTLFLLIFAALASLALTLWAADPKANLSGEWTGTIDVHDTDSGAVVSTNVRMSLTHTDAAISGKIGRDGEADVSPIQNARLDGDKLYFEATNADVNGPIKFVLTRQGDQMEGEMKASVDNGDIVGKVKVSRLKK